MADVYERLKGDYCPKCGKELVIRENGETGEKFWGCSAYPKCKYTREVGPEVHMILAGAERLSGF